MAHPLSGRQSLPGACGQPFGNRPATVADRKTDTYRPRTEWKMIMEDRKSRTVPVVLLSVPEAATALGLSKTMLDELIRSKRLRTVKQGRRRLVPVAALAEYVADLERVA